MESVQIWKLRVNSLLLQLLLQITFIVLFVKSGVGGLSILHSFFTNTYYIIIYSEFLTWRQEIIKIRITQFRLAKWVVLIVIADLVIALSSLETNKKLQFQNIAFYKHRAVLIGTFKIENSMERNAVYQRSWRIKANIEIVQEE